MSKKELTILINDAIWGWIDLPKGKVELRIDKKLVYEYDNE